MKAWSIKICPENNNLSENWDKKHPNMNSSTKETSLCKLNLGDWKTRLKPLIWIQINCRISRFRTDFFSKESWNSHMLLTTLKVLIEEPLRIRTENFKTRWNQEWKSTLRLRMTRWELSPIWNSCKINSFNSSMNFRKLKGKTLPSKRIKLTIPSFRNLSRTSNFSQMLSAKSKDLKTDLITLNFPNTRLPKSSFLRSNP